MSVGYKLTALAAARPGMVLSDVLLDRQGQMLLPQGTTLTDAMLASLRRHGVDMLPIVATGGDPAPAAAADVQARLDHLFRKNDRDDNEDWATGLLRRYVEDYRHGREVAP
jgi:hypothetical protein